MHPVDKVAAAPPAPTLNPPLAPTTRLQTERTDGQTNGRLVMAIPRYALVHRAAKPKTLYNGV